MEAGSTYGPFGQCACLQNSAVGLARALHLLRPRPLRLHLLSQGECSLRVRFGYTNGFGCQVLDSGSLGPQIVTHSVSKSATLWSVATGLKLTAPRGTASKKNWPNWLTEALSQTPSGWRSTTVPAKGGSTRPAKPRLFSATVSSTTWSGQRNRSRRSGPPSLTRARSSSSTAESNSSPAMAVATLRQLNAALAASTNAGGVGPIRRASDLSSARSLSSSM